MNLKTQRGSSLISVMVMVTVILVLLASMLAYAVSQRAAAIRYSRAANQLTCAESGIQLARTYFARNFVNWNTYLSQPNIYNPIQTSWNNPPANFGPGSPLRASNPELFIDVDGDNLPDVYIYIRDNQDEFPPAVDNPLRDNDQNVIVGAICISTTMAPSVAPGQTTPPPMQVESILSFNVGGPQCTQAYCGNGAGNMNG
jgi:type II secretory pathway pseudopilin PulG